MHNNIVHATPTINVRSFTKLATIILVIVLGPGVAMAQTSRDSSASYGPLEPMLSSHRGDTWTVSRLSDVLLIHNDSKPRAIKYFHVPTPSSADELVFETSLRVSTPGENAGAGLVFDLTVDADGAIDYRLAINTLTLSDAEVAEFKKNGVQIEEVGLDTHWVKGMSDLRTIARTVLKRDEKKSGEVSRNQRHYLVASDQVKRKRLIAKLYAMACLVEAVHEVDSTLQTMANRFRWGVARADFDITSALAHCRVAYRLRNDARDVAASVAYALARVRYANRDIAGAREIILVRL